MLLTAEQLAKLTSVYDQQFADTIELTKELGIDKAYRDLTTFATAGREPAFAERLARLAIRDHQHGFLGVVFFMAALGLATALLRAHEQESADPKPQG